MHDIITRDTNGVSWAEVWEFSRLHRDIIDAVIMTKIIVLGITYYADNQSEDKFKFWIFQYGRQIRRQAILENESETESLLLHSAFVSSWYTKVWRSNGRLIAKVT